MLAITVTTTQPHKQKKLDGCILLALSLVTKQVPNILTFRTLWQLLSI